MMNDAALEDRLLSAQFSVCTVIQRFLKLSAKIDENFANYFFVFLNSFTFKLDYSSNMNVRSLR